MPAIAATDFSAPPAVLAHSRGPLVRTYRCDQGLETPAPGIELSQVHVTILPAIHDVWANQRAKAIVDFNRINHGGHLMEHFGGWLIVLLTVQMVAAWNYGVLASRAIAGGVVLDSALVLVATALLNLAFWQRYRGRPARSFCLPGVLLFAVAILPGLILRILNR